VLNFSPEKLLLVFVIALVVLGPNRLPQAARTLGKVVAEMRRMSGTFQAEVRDALVEPRDALSNVVGDLGLDSLRQSLRDTVSGTFDPVTRPEISSTPAGPGVAADVATEAGSTSPMAAAPPAPDDPSYN
jgi:sec-independent protein translocase protein TatB